MIAIWGVDEAARNLVMQICGFERGFGNSRALGIIDRNGVLVGGVVFHNYNADADVIEVSAASLSRKWACRSVLRAITGYCYGDCGCQAIVARTAEENAPVRRLWRALGAQEYVIPRLRGRDKAEAILVLTKESWEASKFAR